MVRHDYFSYFSYLEVSVMKKTFTLLTFLVVSGAALGAEVQTPVVAAVAPVAAVVAPSASVDQDGWPMWALKGVTKGLWIAGSEAVGTVAGSHGRLAQGGTIAAVTALTSFVAYKLITRKPKAEGEVEDVTVDAGPGLLRRALGRTTRSVGSMFASNPVKALRKALDNKVEAKKLVALRALQGKTGLGDAVEAALVAYANALEAKIVKADRNTKLVLQRTGQALTDLLG